jgi:hypothetical protein
MLDNNGLKVANNYFHDLRTDGVRGGGNSNLLVTQNTFTDFHPGSGRPPGRDAAVDQQHHGVGQQHHLSRTTWWCAAPAHPIQGVFMRDIVGNLPFQNVNDHRQHDRRRAV